jgi:hypothetical protein
MADAKFFFKPGEGAHIETRVTLRREKSAAVCGTVMDVTDGIGGDAPTRDAPVQGALVLLFRADDLRFLDRQFTDEDGQFFFGPLDGDELYLVKIHKPGVSPRSLENP